MEKIEVSYSINKSGTYVQFKYPVFAYELNELIAYDKFFQEQIWEMFKELAEKFNLNFSTDSSYLIHEGDEQYLVICLIGQSSPELEKELIKFGIHKES